MSYVKRALLAMLLVLWSVLPAPTQTTNPFNIRSSPQIVGTSTTQQILVGQFDEYNITLTANTPIQFVTPVVIGTILFRINTCQDNVGGWTPTFTALTGSVQNRVGVNVTTTTALACDTEYWSYRTSNNQLVLENVSFNTGGPGGNLIPPLPSPLPTVASMPAYNGSQWVWQSYYTSAPYDEKFIFAGIALGGLVVPDSLNRTLNFPANFTSSTFPDTNSTVTCQTNPAESDDYIIACNGSQIGDVLVSPLCVGTFTTVGGQTQSCSAGQAMTATAPNVVSGTGIAIDLAGHTP